MLWPAKVDLNPPEVLLRYDYDREDDDSRKKRTTIIAEARYWLNWAFGDRVSGLPDVYVDITGMVLVQRLTDGHFIDPAMA